MVVMDTRMVEVTFYNSSTTPTSLKIATTTQEPLGLKNSEEGNKPQLTGGVKLKRKKMKRKRTTR